MISDELREDIAQSTIERLSDELARLKAMLAKAVLFVMEPDRDDSPSIEFMPNMSTWVVFFGREGTNPASLATCEEAWDCFNKWSGGRST